MVKAITGILFTNPIFYGFYLKLRIFWVPNLTQRSRFLKPVSPFFLYILNLVFCSYYALITLIPTL